MHRGQMAPTQDENNGTVTWHRLETGCAYGRLMNQRVEHVEGDVDKLVTKMDRLTWVLGGAAVTFGSAAIMLALNLLLR